MSKRMSCAFLLIAALLAAPTVVVAAPMDQGEAREPGVVAMVWDAFLRLLGVEGGDGGAIQGGEAERPRLVTAHDEGGPHIDP